MPPTPTSTDLASQLATYDAKPVTSTDALNSALSQYGVPEIRQTVSGLRTTLANTQNAYNAVDPSVTGRTQGSLVTEAQRQKQVSNEEAPIASQITNQTGALNQNQQDLTDALGQAQTQATNQVNDYNTGRAALQSEYDTTYKSEQDKAAATLAAQQAAEQQREFNVTSSQKADTTDTAASLAATKAANTQAITQELAKNSGGDGFVSRATFSAALNDFQANGGTTRQFWQQYGRYANPKTVSAYAGYGQR